MIRIIAMEREYGSGGAAIAQKLAGKLGWKLWDQALTCEIARRARSDVATVEKREERIDPLFYRLMKVFLRGSFERSLPVNGIEALDADGMAAMMERIVLDAAADGNCIVVGRGASYFLRERDDVFSVFLYAPREEKLRRLLAAGLSRDDANDRLDTIDRDRAAFIKTYFSKEWPSRELYHQMLNTIVGDDAVIDQILHGIALRERQPA